MLFHILYFSLIAIFLGLSQVAGVGGGPIVNILLMMGMHYPAKLSISITYIFLIGGSIASIWKNHGKKDPAGKLLVQKDLILLTIPTMSSGALFGGIVKNFLSQLIITVLFIVLFIYLIIDLSRTLKKKSDNPQNEPIYSALIQSSTQLQSRQLTSYIFSMATTADKSRVQNKSAGVSSVSQQPANSVISTQQQKLKQLRTLFIGYYLFTVVLSLFRGGKRYNSIIGINSCGFAGWIILLIHLTVSAWVALQMANKVINRVQQSSGKQTVDKDNVWYFLITGFCAGVVGATLAIGGALILIPAWLKLGVNKNTASSTTPTLILISSLIAFTISLLSSQYSEVSSQLMIFYLLLAFVGAALVKDVLTYVSNKYKLKQLVIVLLLIVIICSLLVLVPYQANKMLRNPSAFMQFGQFC